MTPPDTLLLVDLVSSKHACLERLGTLSRRQQELIDCGDVTALLALLAAKQRELEQLHEFERRLDPFRGQDPLERRWSSEAERLRCASLSDQSQRLLEEVMETERRCEEALRRRRDEAAQQLAVVHAAGTARNAYLDETAPAGSSLDLSDDA